MGAQTVFDISFGDCDPAGIVFYPNMFRWMDATFHNFLRPFGGHAKICKDLGAVGLGLIDASAQFRRPMRDGDRLEIGIEVPKWAPRTLTLTYTGRVEDVETFFAKEVRCLFNRTEKGMVADDLALLQARLETQNVE